MPLLAGRSAVVMSDPHEGEHGDEGVVGGTAAGCLEMTVIGSTVAVQHLGPSVRFATIAHQSRSRKAFRRLGMRVSTRWTLGPRPREFRRTAIIDRRVVGDRRGHVPAARTPVTGRCEMLFGGSCARPFGLRNRSLGSSWPPVVKWRNK